MNGRARPPGTSGSRRSARGQPASSRTGQPVLGCRRVRRQSCGCPPRGDVGFGKPHGGSVVQWFIAGRILLRAVCFSPGRGPLHVGGLSVPVRVPSRPRAKGNASWLSRTARNTDDAEEAASYRRPVRVVRTRAAHRPTTHRCEAQHDGAGSFATRSTRRAEWAIKAANDRTRAAAASRPNRPRTAPALRSVTPPGWS